MKFVNYLPPSLLIALLSAATLGITSTSPAYAEEEWTINCEDGNEVVGDPNQPDLDYCAEPGGNEQAPLAMAPQAKAPAPVYNQNVLVGMDATQVDVQIDFVGSPLRKGQLGL